MNWLPGPILVACPDLEKDASGYAIGVVLMPGGKSACYHSNMYHRGCGGRCPELRYI